MIKLHINKTDNRKAIVVADTMEDAITLRFFYDNTWGFHAIWIKQPDKNIEQFIDFDGQPSIESEMIKMYRAKGIDLVCVGQLSCPDGFVYDPSKTAVKGYDPLSTVPVPSTTLVKKIETKNLFEDLLA